MDYNLRDIDNHIYAYMQRTYNGFKSIKETGAGLNAVKGIRDISFRCQKQDYSYCELWVYYHIESGDIQVEQR